MTCLTLALLQATPVIAIPTVLNPQILTVASLGDRVGARTRDSSKTTRTPGSFERESRDITVNRDRMTEKQKSNVQKLATDLQSIQEGSDITPAQVEALAKEFMSLAEQANLPSEASVTKLVEDLTAATQDGGDLTMQEQMQLVKDIEAVLNSANLSIEETQDLMEDTKDLLESANIDQSDVKIIITDLQAIAAEIGD